MRIPKFWGFKFDKISTVSFCSSHYHYTVSLSLCVRLKAFPLLKQQCNVILKAISATYIIHCILFIPAFYALLDNSLIKMEKKKHQLLDHGEKLIVSIHCSHSSWLTLCFIKTPPEEICKIQPEGSLLIFHLDTYIMSPI